VKKHSDVSFGRTPLRASVSETSEFRHSRSPASEVTTNNKQQPHVPHPLRNLVDLQELRDLEEIPRRNRRLECVQTRFQLSECIIVPGCMNECCERASKRASREGPRVATATRGRSALAPRSYLRRSRPPKFPNVDSYREMAVGTHL